MPRPSLRPATGQTTRLKVLRAPEAKPPVSEPFTMNSREFILVGPTPQSHVDGSVNRVTYKTAINPLFIHFVPVRRSN